MHNHPINELSVDCANRMNELHVTCDTPPRSAARAVYDWEQVSCPSKADDLQDCCCLGLAEAYIVLQWCSIPVNWLNASGPAVQHARVRVPSRLSVCMLLMLHLHGVDNCNLLLVMCFCSTRIPACEGLHLSYLFRLICTRCYGGCYGRSLNLANWNTKKIGQVMEALYWLSSVEIWKTLNEIDFHLVLVGFEFPGFVPLACIKTVPEKVPTSALQTIITLERLVGFRQTS